MNTIWQKRVQGSMWVVAMCVMSCVIWLPMPEIIALWLPDGFLILIVAALFWRYPSFYALPIAMWGLWVDVCTQSALGAHMLFYLFLAVLYWRGQKRMLLYAFGQRVFLMLCVVLLQYGLFALLAKLVGHNIVLVGGLFGGLTTWVLLVLVLWYNDALASRKTVSLWLS